ncbi:MAG: hypothetical protein DWQ34_26530 [Planctomycetota bacterium]|nr:MAG: hypothetical protein DWQ34_26530 [Planctomycetota bacterium]REK22779.1 MAG: hypothetical protein DWQ41_18435 [Planctomycetota bacterium]REK33801.1 MAG: hypothetical protein DWQ45_14560 [Planctomycetota bacterium]
MANDRRAHSTVLFAAAVFVSAFLLFQIQPLISKAILPWFGGTPGVWTTCMLFFQVVLFAGYGYAHLVASRAPVRLQGVLHTLLIVIALFQLQVLPGASQKPDGDEQPALRIVVLLVSTIGLPYFLLSTTGPLLQRWFSLVHPGRSPYRLYALSNAGSLLALLSYPFVFEPAFALSVQARLWSIGFWVFAAGSAVCGGLLLRVVQPSSSSVRAVEAEEKAAAPTPGRYVLWFVLAMIASAMLLATTNHVCQDVAVVPFLWVVPLSIYLLTFILCFESDRWYKRRWYAAATAVFVFCVCWQLIFDTVSTFSLEAALFFGTLFVLCMTCHGELARLRPHPRHLTAFYLTLSAGGAGGGLFVALVAPALFPDFWEMHLCLLAGVLCSIAVYFDDAGWLDDGLVAPPIAMGVAVLLIVAAGTVFADSIMNSQKSLRMTRNFYGVLEVEIDDSVDAVVLRHGRIIHGVQLRAPGKSMIPTTYYSRRSGVGRVLELLQSRKENLRVGLVGLGIGTLAAYGRQGDTMRFYEINEDVERLAREEFTFLSNSSAEIEVIIGDARLSLESEPDEEFDLLVLDAFAGDAIPTHLLTREAFEAYLPHVAADGVIAVHISNQHFNLRPVTAALAKEFSLSTVTIGIERAAELVDESSTWVLMARDRSTLDAGVLKYDAIPPPREQVLWTDDYSNLFELLGSE